MSISCRAAITLNLKARLETIKASNGYSTDVKNVYFDKIPMGLQLQNHQLPAILLIQGVDNVSDAELGGCLNGDWRMELQLWHCGNIGDCEMNDFERDVYKAIYANSATAKVTCEFRSIHPKIVRISPDTIEPDSKHDRI